MSAGLNAAARSAQRAHDAAAYAGTALHRGDTLAAKQHVREAKQAAADVVGILITLGADRPGERVVGDSLRLDQLDTPASRRLLAVLLQAQEAGEALDQERGWVLPGDYELLPGESRGTGWAETLSNLAEQLRVEVEGPRGRGE